MRPIVVPCLSLIALVLNVACAPAAAPVLPPTTAVAATSAPGPAATPSDTELQATIVGAFRAQQTRAYQQNSDTVLKDRTTHQARVEFVPPDKYHIVSDGTTELIIVGEVVYLKDQASWTEPNISVDSVIDRGFVSRLERSLSDLKWLGSETVNGLALQVYQYHNALKVGESEIIGQSKVWINPIDHLPYKLVVEGQTAALDNSTGQVTGVPATTTIAYAYDQTIQIAAPK